MFKKKGLIVQCSRRQTDTIKNITKQFQEQIKVFHSTDYLDWEQI